MFINKNPHKEELLTHEVYQRQGVYYLSVPVHDLTLPMFLIKKNSLFIFLYNYSKCYMIKKISTDVLKAIKSGNCYLLENLNQEKPVTHLIKLWQ